MRAFIFGLILGLTISAGITLATDFKSSVQSGSSLLSIGSKEVSDNLDLHIEDCIDNGKALTDCLPDSKLSPLRNGTITINIDLMTQYDQTIRLNHAGETIKLTPIELWRRATLSKKKDSMEELAEESERKTDAYFRGICLNDPDKYYCKFIK